MVAADKAVPVKVAAATTVVETTVVGVVHVPVAKSAAYGDMKPCPAATASIRSTRLTTLVPATPPHPTKMIRHTS
jgi:hypothetical protein